MAETRIDQSPGGFRWEWRAEADEVVNLLTSERVAGQRVHYRPAGSRRWSTFLLTTTDGSMPTLDMFLRAIDTHGAS